MKRLLLDSSFHNMTILVDMHFINFNMRPLFDKSVLFQIVVLVSKYRNFRDKYYWWFIQREKIKVTILLLAWWYGICWFDNLKQYDSVTMVIDTCFGPHDMAPIYDKYESNSNIDFWGD